MSDGAVSPEVARQKLRIGLIVDSPFGSKYARELAEWAQSQGDISISHLLIQEGLTKQEGRFRRLIALSQKRGLSRILRLLSFKIITDLESLLLRRSAIHSDHLKSFDLRPFVPGSLHVTPVVSKSGLIFRYRDDDIRAIKSLGFDLLLFYASGILRGEILTAARFGVLSFHHADNRINRGQPAGFWEVYFRQDSTGFIIQQLTEELDGGNVLFRGAFATKYYYLLNYASLSQRSIFYLKRLLKDIARHRKLPDAEVPTPYFNRLFTTPTWREQLCYLFMLLPRLLSNILDKIFDRHRRCWGVAYVTGDWRGLVMRRGRRIRNPPRRFLADPFVVRENDRDYCFVEDCDLATRKGSISVYRLGHDGAERLGTAINEPFHLSFPYIFKYGSKTYMCPETCEAREIRLYECVAFPLDWKLSRVLMSDVAAVDSMIFEHGQVWWLFTNIEPVAGGDYCSQLSIFYADSPLSENWTPHPKNPIFVDSSRARNGGILFDGDVIYRVAQKQGFNTYGKRASINKIVNLTKTDYREEEVRLIEPNFFDDISATHHLHSNGRVTVFDCFGRMVTNR